MPYYVTLSDKPRFDVEDLPLTRWAAIQKQTGIGWVEALSSGTIASNAAVAIAVVQEVAEHLGVEAPIMSLKEMLKVVTFEARSNNPETFMEGQPDPKVSATEPETT